MAFGQLRAPISIVKSISYAGSSSRILADPTGDSIVRSISYAGSSSRILADPTGERRNRQFRQRFCGLRSCWPDPSGESGLNILEIDEMEMANKLITAELRKNRPENFLLSVVIPCFNEEEVITTLYRRIIDVLGTKNFQLQMVFVDDGSEDQTRN